MELIIPPSVSHKRGGGLPRMGSRDRPLTTIPPIAFRSATFSNSTPYPYVPEAAITGFCSSAPQSVIRRRLIPSKNNIGGPKVRLSGVSLMNCTVEFPIYVYAQGVEKRPNAGTSGALAFPGVQV